jgi:hypothetical protein
MHWERWGVGAQDRGTFDDPSGFDPRKAVIFEKMRRAH